MIHESPYDQREQDGADEDRRQALQDAGEEAMNERRQLRARPVIDYPFPPILGECDDEDPDAAYEPGDPKRSDFLDGED